MSADDKIVVMQIPTISPTDEDYKWFGSGIVPIREMTKQEFIELYGEDND